MDAGEDRLQQLGAQLLRMEARLDVLLDARMAKPPPLPPAAIAAAPPPKSPFGRWVGWMGAELPKMVAAIVVLVLGFWIKDSVDLAIKQRQLDLSYSKEMQALLLQLSSGGSPQQLKTAAVVLASFGAPALPALLSELRQPDSRGDAAAEGLNVLALREPEVVCAALPRLLNLRRQYDWQAHERVVQMLGQHGCPKARGPLQAYRLLVEAAVAGKPERFDALLREPPLNPQEVYPRMLKSVDEALAQTP